MSDENSSACFFLHVAIGNHLGAPSTHGKVFDAVHLQGILLGLGLHVETIPAAGGKTTVLGAWQLQ